MMTSDLTRTEHGGEKGQSSVGYSSFFVSDSFHIFYEKNIRSVDFFSKWGYSRDVSGGKWYKSGSKWLISSQLCL